MKIERLEFVCVNAMKEQKFVTIHVEELKVGFEGKYELIGHDLQNLVAAYLDMLDVVIVQNFADKGQYQQVLAQLAKTIACYALQIHFCDWMAIDKVTPKIVMNMEDFEI